MLDVKIANLVYDLKNKKSNQQAMPDKLKNRKYL